ncbi:signal recognition particle-docking protein FtsY [Corynebacterium rhinophilum]|uniref:signal recognition particle-docking protein FtsY n=1 Tax=Corynebacterium rhinophilum TaxID=3050197 RepID=UPI002550C308|nr:MULTISPECIES: signal recognition particle-docking protein FtsY [unclassified Corynebacterium]MDK8451972.1 signal recognition particle-docking protein FtsY [Corynebacterium sp. MSK084]MDK8491126.1 signal recognition particle-docking protein FtsY [Corynebacterium sp. MSK175]MDK8513909.1 signal recognition particle-docking protein FtsY [Corynebacterium sp. MSK123]MDK8547343.1 signal recognition particle-docking protein FtsY [Corynebacterium sp. MSK222]MDK8697375.1 signal recognition particle-d
MNSLWLWIGIAIVVIVLIVVFIAIGKKRGESKKVSFEKPKEEEPKQLTQEQKSGNYQAKSGFNFAPAGAKEPDKVAQEKPQQAKQEQQPETSEQSEPTATDIANAQLNGEEPPAAKRSAPAKDKGTAPEKAAKQDKGTGKDNGAGDEAKADSESASTPEAKSKPAADKTEGKGAAGTAAAGGVGAAAAAASGDRQESAADDADKEPADQAEDQSDKPDSAQASTPASGEKEAEEKEAKGSEQSAPAAAEKPAAASAGERGEPDHEEKAPEDVVSVEAAEVEDESPVFDAVVDDKDADHIEERVDNHEEAEEAAAAADAQTDAAEAAKEQTPVPDGEPAAAGQPTEDIAPAGGRLGRLRGRLSRSQNAIGQGLMGILSAGDLDEDAWEEIEDTLIMADLGTKSTMKVTDSLRDKIAERGVSSEEEARAMLRECLIEACHPEMDRSIRAMPNDGKPAIVMVVGVNGTGKTTTTGKLARVLVSMDHSVLLGAADTFRAAAADQLETWGRRVGTETVRGKEGADPASVAFDAVATGVEQQVDVVLVDTAGRLHTSTDLMDQLGKVKRVVEKKTEVDEVLLVLDATVGQNGLAQARIFREVVDISGVVLTKLDGTAKGGIVFQVQEELGVPVKLVGLGEGADDLAPFEVEGFVDALLGEK